MANKVLLVAELKDGNLKKTTFEIATAAQSLNLPVSAVMLGNGIKEQASELGKYGVTEVFVADDAKLELYANAAYAEIISNTIKENGFDIVLFSASSTGKDLAPMVAGKLNCGLVADAVGIKLEDGKFLVKRPVYAGKAFLNMEYSSDVMIASIRPNAYQVTEKPVTADVKNIEVFLDDKDLKAQVQELIKTLSARPELTEANVIVSGGRGMGGPEHYPVIEELADLLGAAVGASRAAVDAGWRPHSDQVGQTGKTVSPNLYIACGISGAIQHLAGMSSSKYIVAINKDPEAPIFKLADLGIVGDLFDVVPAMVAELKK